VALATPGYCFGTSHPGQLSLAIPRWFSAMNADDVTPIAREENDEFCIAVSVQPRLPIYWHRSLAVKLSQPSGWSRSYAGLIGFSPRRFKAPKGMWSEAVDLMNMCKILFLFFLWSMGVILAGFLFGATSNSYGSDRVWVSHLNYKATSAFYLYS